MFNPRFIIKGINREGTEERASAVAFSSVYRAELAALEFYGDPAFKTVWVERLDYGESTNSHPPGEKAA